MYPKTILKTYAFISVPNLYSNPSSSFFYRLSNLTHLMHFLIILTAHPAPRTSIDKRMKTIKIKKNYR